MGSSSPLINEFKASMDKKFKMTDLAELQYFLGLEVKQVEDGIFVSKKKYAADLLKRFNILGYKIAATPTNLNEKLQVNDVISRFMHYPSKHHFRAAKRVLRYIARTVDFGIWYGHVSEFKLFGYTDSDWAGCLEDRRSTSSYVFSLGSAAVCWSSKKQTTTALSSSEAEYTTASSSAC
ncbi:secreted RxLR effector protein 161-like [Hevea brasiliensis]|uniref:secreted RxLR effector protein 161-like n=1 Tax=Hevea brasiliensis TaxID=3981 RepID=UPI0025DB4909|nr:secreted RxLR effector protein 161-like [Hevea brasiliensis]